MPTTLVVPVLVLLWAAVLAPGILRRVRERRTVEGIDTFQQSLHLLDRSATDADHVAALPPRRPQLVLLRPTSASSGADTFVDQASGECFERVPVAMAPRPAPQRDRDRQRKRQLADRRRRVLGILVALLVVLLAAGVVTGALLVWAMLGLVVAALGAYLWAVVEAVRRHDLLQSTRALRATDVADEVFEESEQRWVAAR